MAGPAAVEAVEQVVAGQQRGRRDHHRAELHRRQHDLPQRHDVAEHQQDAVAALARRARAGSWRPGSERSAISAKVSLCSSPPSSTIHKRRPVVAVGHAVEIIERPVEPVEHRPAEIAIGPFVILAGFEQEIAGGEKLRCRHADPPCCRFRCMIGQIARPTPMKTARRGYREKRGMGWLDGQVALVTGGGSGIGRAVVARFVEEGARVGVMERVATRAAELRDEFGDRVIGIAGDVAQLADNKRAVAETVRAFGRLDVFVGNAGIFDVYAKLAEFDEERLGQAFDELFGVNVKGCIFGAKAALPELRQDRRLHGVHRLGGRAELGRRRRALYRLEARRGRADPAAGGGAGAAHPGQRRRARAAR